MQELKCLNCGSPLEKSGDTYTCKYCGSEYSDDEISNVINNYGTANIVINNIKSDKASVEDYLSEVEKNISLRNYAVAIEILDEAVKFYADNYKIWMAYVRAYTENYTKFFDKKHEVYLEKANAVANETERAKIKDEYAVFIRKRDAEINRETVKEEERKSSVGWFIAIIITVCVIALVVKMAS